MRNGHDGLFIEVGVKDHLHYSVNAKASVPESPVDSRLNRLRAADHQRGLGAVEGGSHVTLTGQVRSLPKEQWALCLKSNWRFSQLWVRSS
jgi:hypothetical protein